MTRGMTKILKKRKQKCLLLCRVCTLFIYVHPQCYQQTFKKFNLSCLCVNISYHIFNNLSELLNKDLTAKIGHGILSCDIMDICFNCSLPSKANGKCVYESKCKQTCLIYEVK